MKEEGKKLKGLFSKGDRISNKNKNLSFHFQRCDGLDGRSQKEYRKIDNFVREAFGESKKCDKCHKYQLPKYRSVELGF